jgi:lipopolysaccharide/colanic/teichoic acid biosynthesis glycosyltransferase
VKRTFDIALAAAGLALSWPLWLLVALAIRLEDGGPVFFRQSRYGQGGVPFTALKFRSMVAAAGTRAAVAAQANDPRITRVGRLLRQTALDELPQLWNILRGDMSFVGPRALATAEVEVGGDGRAIPQTALPGFAERHRVRPGLTGLAQIYASRDLARVKKYRYDRLYARRRSFWLDVRLVLLSFWITATGRWERRGPKA